MRPAQPPTPNEEYYSVPPLPTVSNYEVLTGGSGGTRQEVRWVPRMHTHLLAKDNEEVMEEVKSKGPYRS